MKRIAAFLCAFILLLGLVPTAGAVEQAGIRFYDESAGCYGPVTPSDLVSVVFDGERLALDVPAVTRVMEGNDARTMVPVAPIALALGAQVLWVEETRQVILLRGEDTIVLTLGSPTATVNGEAFSLPGGVSADIAKYDGVERTMVPLLFVSQQLHASVGWDGETFTASVSSAESETPSESETPVETETPSESEPPAETEPPADPEPTPPPAPTLVGYSVTLDAGHGGWSSGAVYEDIMEKDIDLAVTLRTAQLLREMGCDVVMVREDDSFMDIHDRASFANEAGTDIFVSIHANANPNSSIEGIYTYYYPTSRKGKVLAQCVQSAAAAASGAKDRGLMTDDLVVIRETKMPAVLVELGFMTCHEELMRLADPAYQQKLAQGIAAGVEDYLLNHQ